MIAVIFVESVSSKVRKRETSALWKMLLSKPYQSYPKRLISKHGLYQVRVWCLNISLRALWNFIDLQGKIWSLRLSPQEIIPEKGGNSRKKTGNNFQSYQSSSVLNIWRKIHLVLVCCCCWYIMPDAPWYKRGWYPMCGVAACGVTSMYPLPPFISFSLRCLHFLSTINNCRYSSFFGLNIQSKIYNKIFYCFSWGSKIWLP